MKIFFLAALIVMAIAGGCEAFAQTACPSGTVAENAARMCWRNATDFVTPPGGTIPADGPTSLVQTELQHGVCTASAGPSSTSSTTVPSTIGFVLYENLAAGVWCFRGRHILLDGTAGPWSSWVRKTTTAPTPPKPRSPAITVG